MVKRHDESYDEQHAPLDPVDMDASGDRMLMDGENIIT
jgi:hypothetical protein